MSRPKAAKPINPRVAAFFARFRLDPAIIGDEERRYISDPENPNDSGQCSWVVYFTQWNRRMLIAWATELGFKRDSVREAHEHAWFSGHTHESYNLWLAQRVDLELRAEP